MDMKYIIGIIVVLIVIVGAYLAFAGGGGQKVTIVGSTSVQPVAEKLAEAYMKEHPNVKITVQGGGSAVGLKSAQDGTANIGTYSSKLSANNSAGITQYQIAKDGIVVVVNNANSISDLSKDQVKSIFGGNSTDWSNVGGNSGKITVVTREEGSGTRDAFISLIMGGKNGTNITGSAIVQSSTEAIKQAVKGDPNAIGYISLADLNGDVKALKIGGITPSEQTVKDGTYVVQRPFIFLTKGDAKGATKDFIDWVLSPAGQAIVQKAGAVPVGPTQ
ncbi:MAG TPA: phosphate ABC transporter substrate-binding protein [Methanobacteriaceae archaeon]|nr:phosphate ABC transporter substrate-binding protein [Methanobacteriaceae archaeon]